MRNSLKAKQTKKKLITRVGLILWHSSSIDFLSAGRIGMSHRAYLFGPFTAQVDHTVVLSRASHASPHFLGIPYLWECAQPLFWTPPSPTMAFLLHLMIQTFVSLSALEHAVYIRASQLLYLLALLQGCSFQRHLKLAPFPSWVLGIQLRYSARTVHVLHPTPTPAMPPKL